MRNQYIYPACFFLSGAAGLIYQIVWVRMLSLIFGNTTYAVAMVVAGFLSGLALGSYLWGKMVDHAASPVRMYIRLEIGIAISALAITALITILDNTITRVMTVKSLESSIWQLIRYGSVFLILLIPTFLIGGTSPVMSKFYIKNIEKVGLGIGSLYAANTYGGMAGAFFSGILLIPILGMMGTVKVALILNLFVAGAVWLISSKEPVSAEVKIKNKSTPRSKRKRKKDKFHIIEETKSKKIVIPSGLALTLVALSGFCALSLEILWTRALIVSFKPTVYLFSNLLTVFLFGIALGSHVFSKILDNREDLLKLFGFAQIAIGICGIISIIFFLFSGNLAAKLGRIIGEMNWAADIFVMLLLMLIAFSIPAFFMGLAYPLICRVTTQSLKTLGLNVGKVFTVGTLGGVIGSLLAGFFLLPLFGLQHSIFVVSLIALVNGYIALFNTTSKKGIGWAFPASAICAIATFVTLEITGVNIGLGLNTRENVIYAKEGIMGTVRVTQKKENGPLTLIVNTYQLATSGDVAVRFGHLPLLLKPDSKDVLLISLGSGITAGSIGGHPVERIDCVEIVPTLVEIQRFFEGFNHKIINDRRFNLTFWDGRHYVKVTKQDYDLVISDLFQPDSAGVGSLYTLEHFLNVKDKLKKGGAMAQWLPMYQLSPENLKVIIRTFATAFEYVTIWGGDINSELPTLMLFGSSQPLRINPNKLAKALERDAVKRDMIEYKDPMSLLSFFIMNRDEAMDFTEGYPVNTDDKPVIEYTAPRNIWNRRQNTLINFSSLIERRQKVTGHIMGAEHDSEFSNAIASYYDGRTKILQGKVAHANRKYSAEFEKYKEAAKLVPGDPNLALAVFDLGYLYYHRRDYKTASKLFKWAKQVSPNLLEAHFYLAKSHQNMGMRDASLKAFEELAALRPDIAEMLTIK